MSEKSSLLQALQAQRAVLKLTIQLAFFVRRRLFKRSSATSLNFQVNRPLINWEKIELCHVCHYRAFIAFSITILGKKKLQPPFKVYFMSVFFFWKSSSNFG